MQIKLLKDIVSNYAGSHGSKVVDLLYNKKNVNEFLIAKKLDLTINQTRNILYKLSDEGLVSFIRKKDNKKGGWYTYFWTLNSGKSLVKFKESLERNLEELKRKLVDRQNARYFYCTNCDIEYTEENALLNSYTCPECGEPLELKDNSSDVKVIEKEINSMVTLLEEVKLEVDIIEAKEQKSKDRKVKLEIKKKALERQERKKARDKEKQKDEKKSKKTSKTKTAGLKNKK